MKEILYSYLQSNTGALTLEDILINFLAAGFLGMIVYFSYRFSHSNAVYSARFNVSLVMLVLTTTLVMNVIGNNIALSLGMVGALSIVRFRTAIKDPRDATYIFWSIAIGICCGVSEYLIAAIGSCVIFLFMLLFGAIRSNERFLLVIRSSRDAEAAIDAALEKMIGKKANLRVKNTTEGSMESIYECSSHTMNMIKKRGISIMDSLYEVEGVIGVNIVCQNEEING